MRELIVLKIANVVAGGDLACRLHSACFWWYRCSCNAMAMQFTVDLGEVGLQSSIFMQVLPEDSSS